MGGEKPKSPHQLNKGDVIVVTIGGKKNWGKRTQTKEDLLLEEEKAQYKKKKLKGPLSLTFLLKGHPNGRKRPH